MKRAEKEEFVASLQAKLQGVGSIVVAHYSGLTVSQLQEFRREMRKAVGSVGSVGSVRVVKNRLLNIAIQGTSAAPVMPLLNGPTIISYSSDPIAAPKACVTFAKNHEKLVILGGAMDGFALNRAGVETLAALPSLDELRANIVGLLVAAPSKIARLQTAVAGQLARVLSAYAEKA